MTEVPPAGDDPILASDAEREAAASALAQHLGEGRLSIDEYQERLDRAYAARTRGGLAAVMRHLPALAPTVRRDRLSARAADSTRYLVGLATPTIVSVAVWAASGRQGSFWPVWGMVGSIAVGLRHFAPRWQAAVFGSGRRNGRPSPWCVRPPTPRPLGVARRPVGVVARSGSACPPSCGDGRAEWRAAIRWMSNSPDWCVPPAHRVGAGSAVPVRRHRGGS